MLNGDCWILFCIFARNINKLDDTLTKKEIGVA